MRQLKYGFLYLAMTGGAIAALLAIRAAGEGLSPAPGAPRSAPSELRLSPDTLFHVLLALVAVIVVARLTGMVLRRFGQPPVIGETLAGIMLGPSLLGRLSPDAAHYLFPPSTVPLIGIVSQIGIIIYMFLVGLRLEVGQLRTRAT